MSLVSTTVDLLVSADVTSRGEVSATILEALVDRCQQELDGARVSFLFAADSSFSDLLDADLDASARLVGEMTESIDAYREVVAVVPDAPDAIAAAADQGLEVHHCADRVLGIEEYWLTPVGWGAPARHWGGVVTRRA